LDVILALPRDTDHVRDVLFDLPMPFSLSQTNNEQFGPLIDNAYSIRHSDNVGFRKRDGRPAHVQHRVICRFKISRDTRDPSAKPLRLIASGQVSQSLCTLLLASGKARDLCFYFLGEIEEPNLKDFAEQFDEIRVRDLY
jgi:hypothetical protein